VVKIVRGGCRVFEPVNKNTINKMSVLTRTDSYKLSHKGFMHPKTEYIYSNFTPRTHKHFPVPAPFFDGKAVFFSLQFFIKDYLINEWNREFFNKPKQEVIEKFKRRTDSYLGKGAVCMDHFEKLHDLGFLPISIKALPEGSSVPMKIPFLTIINTHPDFAWLTNYLETVLSCEIWKPCYTATLVKAYRKIVNIFADETVGNRNHTIFSLHGFEFRGMSGRHDAAICGAGLLLSSCGTDTIPSIDLVEDYYNADVEKELIAASVPASEHSISSLGTSLASELDFFRDAITKHYPKGIVSLVSDTYDFFRVVTEFATILKDDILNRQINEIGLAKVVFRPDSGDPIKIVCGDPEAPIGSPQHKGAVECLWEIFGGSISEKGYKVLNERVGLIYGDGAQHKMIYGILQGLKEKGFASNNIVFGVGSFSMTLATRDSLGMAQKATWAQVDSIGYDIYKDPVTDDGMKKSAKGLLRVDKINGEFVLKDQCSKEEEAGGELKEVFRDGKLLIDQTFAEIRARANS
jgi:nicotinamide phosphoribosyltransferase